MDKKDLLSVSVFFLLHGHKKPNENGEEFIKYKFVFYTLRVQFLFYHREIE